VPGQIDWNASPAFHRGCRLWAKNIYIDVDIDRNVYVLSNGKVDHVLWAKNISME
jgi:hypothetical protein